MFKLTLAKEKQKKQKKGSCQPAKHGRPIGGVRSMIKSVNIDVEGRRGRRYERCCQLSGVKVLTVYANSCFGFSCLAFSFFG